MKNNIQYTATTLRTKVLILLLILSICSVQTFATHLVGAEITYKNINGDTYEITLVVYEECPGLGITPSTEDITISSSSCSFIDGIILANIDNAEITNICLNNGTTCSGGGNIGFQKHVYRGNYTFSVHCTDWIVEYGRCCRIGTIPITNLDENLGNDFLHVIARLNNLNFTTNNSPQFTSDPIVYICNNTPITYQHMTSESDGDVLVYSLVQPMKYTNTTIPYSTGYSINYPIITTTGTFDLNTSNGQMNFTPNGEQNCAVSMQIDEYRNGTLIGSVMREILIIVPNNCSGVSPLFTYDNLDVTSSITWSTGMFPNDKIYVNGTITIGSTSFTQQMSGSLTINSGVTVEFGTDAKIIVGYGGTLTLDGATLGGLTTCQKMWQGIEVWGYCCTASGKGKIVMRNNAIIREAHNAVILGKVCLTCVSAPYDNNEWAGEINATNSIFKDNAVDVKYVYNRCRFGKIQNCTFTSLAGWSLRDPRYNSSNANPYPDANHPHYAAANTTGRAAIGIYLLNSNIQYSSISPNTYSNLETGIDNYFSLAYFGYGSNTFTNLTNGIRVFSGTSKIADNVFTNVINGVFVDGGSYINISNNTFINTIQGSSIGIWLNNPQGLNITSNDFNLLNNAIIIDNSGIRGGSINSNSSGLGNSFTNCFRGIVTNNDNSNLQIRCGNFTPDLTGSTYNNNWYIINQLANQGKNNPANDKSPAGNQFFTSTRKHIYSVTNRFTYYRHSSPATVIPIPTGVLLAADIVNVGIAKTSNSCKPFLPLYGGSNSSARRQLLVEKKQEIIQLLDELESARINLDRGRTGELIQKVQQTGMETQKLKQQLLLASPLSDEVLNEVINKTPALPPAILQDVMMVNLPVSEVLWVLLESKLSSLPMGIAKSLQEAQVSNPFVRTLTNIGRDIVQVAMERTLILNEEVEEQIPLVGGIESAIALLEQENTVDADRALVNLYLAKAKQDQGAQCQIQRPIAEHLLAKSRLDNMLLSTPEDLAWAEMMNMHIQLEMEGKMLFELDHQQRSRVSIIADSFPVHIAGSEARNILRVIENRDFQTVIPDVSASGKTQTLQSDEELLNDLNYLYIGKNIPNPFYENTVIPYYLPKDMSGSIIVFDLTGRVLKTYSLQEDSNLFIIKGIEFDQGVYIYGVEINGLIKEYRKMAVVK